MNPKQRSFDPALNREPSVALPDEGELGPAMRALATDRMRHFVIAMHEHSMAGDESPMRAAQAAGYSGNTFTLAVTGHRLSHDSRIQAAMLEEGQRRLGALIPVAANTLAQLIREGKPSQKLRAIGMVMNRAGLPEKTEHKVVVTHQLTEEEQIARIHYLANLAGVDATLLLGQAAVVELQQLDAETVPTVEAEFEEDFQ